MTTGFPGGDSGWPAAIGLSGGGISLTAARCCTGLGERVWCDVSCDGTSEIGNATSNTANISYNMGVIRRDLKPKNIALHLT